MSKINWLELARELQSMGQIGLQLSENHYELERSKRLTEISAEIIQEYSNLEKDEVREFFTTQVGYATPKVDVRSAVIRDGKILLVKEISDGKWAMPGGWADVGDIPSEAAERETMEESGLLVKARKVVGVFDANRVGRRLDLFHAFKIIFLCEIIGGEPKPSEETSEARFFDFEELPPLSKNRTNEKHLKETKRFVNNASAETYFD